MDHLAARPGQGSIVPVSGQLPDEIEADLAKARRLEWWTLGAMTTVVVFMGAAAGSSQAMKTAWIEDMLSLVPAIVFLVAAHLEPKQPTRLFPFGFHRVHSLAFLISAVTLSAVGLLLFVELAMTLVKMEHVTVGPVSLFGHDVWSGWLMIGALGYSIVPPVILGQMKLPIARRLQDKVLHTDAMMQKADWMTGLAGIAGIIGIGFGLWWADAVAAAIISLSIIMDGVKALRSATAELVDGAPRALDRDVEATDAVELRHALERRYPGSAIRLRETGRFILAEVEGAAPEGPVDLRALWPGDPNRSWRLARLSFVSRCA
jgi:cation diffusion facilitator family transporter